MEIRLIYTSFDWRPGPYASSSISALIYNSRSCPSGTDNFKKTVKLAVRLTLVHFQPTNSLFRRPEVKRPTAEDLERIRKQEQEAELDIAASLESWKEKRRLKSQKSREFITGGTVAENSSASLREAESGTIPRTPNKNIANSKYKELAQRYSDDVQVLEEEYSDEYSETSEEVFEVFEHNDSMHRKYRFSRGLYLIGYLSLLFLRGRERGFFCV